MVSEASPFRPGMGRVPPAMSGRDEVLARYHAWFGTKNSHGEVAIVEGHRGVGKTSLLKVIGAQAVSADWIHLHLETTEAATLESLLADVDLDRLLDELGRLPRIGRRLKELSAELKLWSIGAQDLRDLRLLADDLGITSAAEVLAVVNRFFPDDPLHPKAQAAVDDLFG